jgi:hypothetical protein|nr:MAG TPA: hypothetical protein [Bacteriophage sp.]
MDNKVNKILEGLNEVNEASLGRLYQHIGKDCCLFITAFRSENDLATNKKDNKALCKELRSMGFGYNKIKGGYVESVDGKNVEVEEESVVAYCSASEGEMLLKLGKKLGEKFLQDSIMFVDASGRAKLYATRTDSTVANILDLGRFTTKTVDAYYTKIGKKKFSFAVSEDGFTGRFNTPWDSWGAKRYREIVLNSETWEDVEKQINR